MRSKDVESFVGFLGDVVDVSCECVLCVESNAEDLGFVGGLERCVVDVEVDFSAVFMWVWRGKSELCFGRIDVKFVLLGPVMDLVEVRLEVDLCCVDIRVCGCDGDVVRVYSGVDTCVA